MLKKILKKTAYGITALMGLKYLNKSEYEDKKAKFLNFDKSEIKLRNFEIFFQSLKDKNREVRDQRLILLVSKKSKTLI